MAKAIFFSNGPMSDPSMPFGVPMGGLPPVVVQVQEGTYTGGGARSPLALPPDHPCNVMKGNKDMRFAELPARANDSGLTPFVGLTKGR